MTLNLKAVYNNYIFVNNKGEYMSEEKSRSRKIIRHLSRVTMAVLSASLMVSPALALDPSEAAGQVLGNKGGREVAKEALNTALKAAKSKPAMSAATTIVCLACIPGPGIAASPGLCIACGILIAKTFG